MNIQGFRVVAGTAFLSFALGALSAPPVELEDYEGAIGPDELYIVNCLLPPQVRQLGRNYTYLSQRRPVKTTARNCATRGGEYVAYDRANFGTALKVWLPQAQAGDPQAQTIVGELYEEGKGVEPDFQAARQWYEKAAEQGFARAQINLGNMYETGMGVPRDTTRAMNYYRAASGITEGTLELTTDAELAARERQAREAEQLRRDVADLRQRLASAERDTLERRRELQRAQRELATLRVEVAGRDVAEVDPSEVESLRARNRQLEQRLDAAQARQMELVMAAEQAQSVGSGELAALQRRVNEQRLAMEAAKAELAQLREDLSRARQQSSAQVSALQVELNQREAQLLEQEQQFALERQRLQAGYEESGIDAATQQELQARDLEIAQLQNELAQAEARLVQNEAKLVAQSDQAQSRINELEAEIQAKELELAQVEQSGEQLRAQVGAKGGIQIISPALATTRGVKSVTLLTDVAAYEIIGTVTPREDLIAFRVNDQDRLATVDANGMFQVQVPVSTQGATPVAIEAVRENGSRLTESFLLQRDVTPVAQRSTSKAFRKRLRKDLGDFYALVIGNNNYRAHQPLQTAVNDARSVADVLRDRYGFRVTLLTNAAQRDILEEFARLSTELEAQDNLLIYYAGHGRLAADGEEGYWLGVDASASQDQSWIPNAAISDYVGAMEAKHVMVIADSCYAGTLTGDAIRALPINASDEDLLFVSRVKARTALTSGGLQPVIDDAGDGHSIFAAAFLQALRRNADVMEGYRLYDQLRADVQARSRLARAAQNPEYSAIRHAGHEGSEFFFVPERDAVAALPRQRDTIVF